MTPTSNRPPDTSFSCCTRLLSGECLLIERTMLNDTLRDQLIDLLLT